MSTTDNVLPMLLRSACRIVPMLPALWLGGCSDTLTAQAPPSAATLSRDYDRTLTKEQQKKAISDLRSETQQKDASAAEAAGDQAGN